MGNSHNSSRILVFYSKTTAVVGLEYPIWLDMVALIGTFWKLDPLAAYLPNLKDGLYPVVRPTAKELLSV